MKYRHPIFIIFLVTLACHWLVIFNDGVYYDGWLLDSWVREAKSLSFFNEYFLNVGKPIFGVFFWLISLAPSWLSLAKTIAFFSVFLIGVLQWKLLKHSVFDDKQSLAITLISISYPGFSMLVEPVTLQYIASYVLFLYGLYLFLKSLNRKNGFFVLRVIANASIYLGFFMGSLLFLHYFCLVYLLSNSLKNFGALKSKLISSLDLFLLPLIFLVTRSIFFPPKGIYTEHYALKFNLEILKNVYKSFSSELLVGELFRFWNTYSSLINIACFALLLFLLRRFTKIQDFINGQKKYNVVFIGVVALLSVALPYALVNQRFQSLGWSTKNNILVGLPLAVVLFAIAEAVPVKLQMKLIFLAAVFFHFIISNNHNYLNLQVASVKDKAVTEQLKKNPDVATSSLFKVYDGCRIAGFSPQYDSYFISFVLSKGFEPVSKNGRVIGNLSLSKFSSVESEKIIQGYVPYLATPKVDPNGPQALIELAAPNQQKSYFEIVSKYYFNKFFQPNELPTYLRSLCSVKVTPLN